MKASNIFKPGRLPNNALAMKNMLYLHPNDFDVFFKQNGSRQPVFVKCKQMVMRLAADDRINVGELGCSSLQKEFLRLSKIDDINIELMKVNENNPLGLVECSLDIIFRDEKMPLEFGKATQLNE